MRHRWYLALIAVFVVVVGALMAQDDRGNVNDPGFNERANACFAGGSLEGKCHTTDADFDGDIDDLDIAYMWWCGWYKIRVEYKQIPRSAAPQGCQPLLRLMSVPGGGSAGGGGGTVSCGEPPLQILYFTVCEDLTFTLPCPGQGNLPTTDNPSYSTLERYYSAGSFSFQDGNVLLFDQGDDQCPSLFITESMWDDFVRDWELIEFGWPE